MTMRKLFLTAIAGVVISTGAAMAAPDCARDREGCRNDQHHDDKGAMRSGAMGDAMRGGHDNNNRGGTHDRYWQPQYHGFVAQDRVFAGLRGHGYSRFNGAPYWFQGRYIVRSFDRFGRPIFVEINPYTGDFIGVVRF